MGVAKFRKKDLGKKIVFGGKEKGTQGEARHFQMIIQNPPSGREEGRGLWEHLKRKILGPLKPSMEEFQ